MIRNRPALNMHPTPPALHAGPRPRTAVSGENGSASGCKSDAYHRKCVIQSLSWLIVGLPCPGPASDRKGWSEGHVAVRKTSRSTGERLVARLLATASSGRWHSPLTPLRLMLSEWTSNPGRSCSGPWSADAVAPSSPRWLVGGIRSVLLDLLNLLLHIVCRENRPLLSLSGAFGRLRDSQRRRKGIVPRTLVSEFPIFGRRCSSAAAALR